MSDPERLERYLQDFGARLASAAPDAQRAGGPRRLMRRRKTLPIAIAVITLGTTAGGIALAVEGSDREDGLTATELTGSYGIAPIGEAEPSQQTGFALFRRAVGASDGLSQAERLLLDRDGSLADKYGTNLELARTVSSGSATRGTIKVIPGRDFICLFVPDGNGNAGGTCQRTARARSGGLWTTSEGAQDQAPGEAFLVGLAPDGVTDVMVTAADGTQQQLCVRNNVYAGTVVDAHGISFTTGDGRRQTVNIGPER